MRYESAATLRMALEARINAKAESVNAEVLRLRRSVAFERFLVRLAADDPNLWVLKGGTALEVRFGSLARATQDVDLAFAGAEPAEVATERILDAITEDPHGDQFRFDVTESRTLSIENVRGSVIRLSVTATLDGRVFERFTVDLVSSHGEPIPTEFVLIGSALEFAELPSIEIALLGLNAHFADKIEALCKRHGERSNTRVKDLVDLVILIDDGLSPSAELVEAVNAIFDEKGLTPPGPDLPELPAEWPEPFATMAEAVGLSTVDSNEALQRVEAFWRQALAARSTTLPADL